MSTSIKIENLSKQYRLGLVSTRTLSHDLNRWWHMNILGNDDPYLKVGEKAQGTEHRARSEERRAKREEQGVKSDLGHVPESEVEKKSEITNLHSAIANPFSRSLPHAPRPMPSSDYIWALRDINLEVEQGEVLGIIGKNGAGKSTLLKILSKVTAPTTGTIKAKGRIASLLEVGTGFHPEMTGRENIFMNGAVLGMKKAEIKSKFDEIVDFSGVERYIDTPVKRYSSGMLVRLGFAVAAHLEPEILIVDEVLAVGDAEFQKKAIGKMQDISQGLGRTVLFVSHNLTSVKQLCTKGIVLNCGFISFSGSIEESVQYYLQETNIKKRITSRKYDIGNFPRGEIVELHEYSLINSENKTITRFNLYDTVNIELIYRVKRSGNIIIPNIHFFNQQDQCLFVIGTNDDSKITSEGIFKTTFKINAYTFNVGIFKAGIGITCYPGNDVQFFINPAISFEVEEQNVELRKSSFTGTYPGDLRLFMNNETIRIDI